MSIDPVQAAVAFIPSSVRADPAPERRQQSAPVVESAPTRVTPDTPEPRPLPQAREFQVSASFGNGHLVIYRILDKKTGDLIEQIPPEQFLEAARDHQEAAANAPSNQKLDLKF